MKTRPGAMVFVVVTGLALASPAASVAATPGLPFTEDLSDDALQDAGFTNAN